MSVQLGEETYLTEVLINLELFDIGMSFLLHDDYCTFGDKEHFSSLFFLFKYMIIHTEGFIHQ